MDQTSYTDHLSSLEYFQSSDGKIAYLDKGAGPCLLLLHGVPTSSWLYRKMYPDLVKKGYRLIIPDMLGFGASDKPAGYEIYSAANAGKRILELMSFLNIDSWTQVFHDGGGLWTWEMLAQDSSKVKQLIMLNTIVYQAGFKPPMKFEPGFIAKIYTKWYCSRIMQSMIIRGTFSNGLKDKSVINKKMLRGYKEPLVNNGHRALYYFFTQTCREIPDYHALHQSLNIPLTVIWGKEDPMLLWEPIIKDIEQIFGIGDDAIHLLDAKHFIQEEKAEKIVQIICEEAKG